MPEKHTKIHETLESLKSIHKSETDNFNIDDFGLDAKQSL